MIGDWETGQLYWKMFEKYGDEKIACEKVREKYLDDFARTKDLYLYLGTTKLNQFRAPNPFVIIGTFHPKPIVQPSLFDGSYFLPPLAPVCNWCLSLTNTSH